MTTTFHDVPGWGMLTAMAINITGDPVADRVLSESPFALLLGMLLDQHIVRHEVPARLQVTQESSAKDRS